MGESILRTHISSDDGDGCGLRGSTPRLVCGSKPESTDFFCNLSNGVWLRRFHGDGGGGRWHFTMVSVRFPSFGLLWVANPLQLFFNLHCLNETLVFRAYRWDFGGKVSTFADADLTRI